MKHAAMQVLLVLAFIFCAGCVSTDRLPSEDIEVLTVHKDLIAILRNPDISPDSQAKYEAAKELIRKVDLTFTRETATVDKLFYYKDAQIEGLNTEEPIFTFVYRYGNDFVSIRFFTCRMFITRVEIKENE